MKKKIFFLLLLICTTIVPFTSLADDTVSESVINRPVDLSAKCSINLEFKHKDIVFENEPVELYKIADISTNYIFSLTEEFEGTEIVLNGGITKGEWNTIRTTIESYIVSENILPLKVDFTDENGQIRFDNLEPGMYFTSSIHTARNDVGYAFDSVLSSLPNLKDGEPVYDVEVNTKPYREDVPADKIKYRVSKLWKDDGYQKLRPVSIEVEIFKNKELYEKVVLNNENNWFYSWEAEDDGSDWTVSEIILTDDYYSLVEKRATSFILINDYKKDNPPEDTSEPNTPSSTDKPSESFAPTESDSPAASDTPIVNTDSPSSDAAPTGDTTNLGTYLTVMCLVGIALIIVSVIGSRTFGKEDNN